jgi:hypothetical protein
MDLSIHSYDKGQNPETLVKENTINKIEPIFTDFDDLFHHYKNEIFDKSSKIKLPNKEDIFNIYNEYVIVIYNNFSKLKSSIYPPISSNFQKYIKENLTIGPFGIDKHSPFYYTSYDKKDSFNYAAPEIIRSSWINFKISKLWYEKLLEIGYIVEE